MYGVGNGVGAGVGEGVGVGKGEAENVGLGVGVGVGAGDSDSRTRVPHRRREPIATLSLPRTSVRSRAATELLNVRPRVTVPLMLDVTVGNASTRAPSLEQLPVYRPTQ